MRNINRNTLIDRIIEKESNTDWEGWKWRAAWPVTAIRLMARCCIEGSLSPDDFKKHSVPILELLDALEHQCRELTSNNDLRKSLGLEDRK